MTAKRPNRKPDITIFATKCDVYFWVTEVTDYNNVKFLYAYDSDLWGSSEASWAQIRDNIVFFSHSYEECTAPWSADSELRVAKILEATKLWIDEQVEKPLIGEDSE